ncbi:hypothetical protein ACIGXM_05745 [Kitasatospora sp. NPDC052896]|uniref:hypothetical protein n=1 Tax=Kitasatospora sp. NPDC052896 TaxID=3364061 RepID=UPI0037C77020
MNEFELRQTEQALREVLSGSALEWVLNEVDAAIAEGVAEEKVLRRRNRSGQQRRAAEGSLYEALERSLVSAEEYEASRKRGSLVITTRAMTVLERVELLLQALRRVLVEVPLIEEETLKSLMAAPADEAGQRAAAEGVSFEPEEDAFRSRDQRADLRYGRVEDEERERLTVLFNDAMSEVQS